MHQTFASALNFRGEPHSMRRGDWDESSGFPTFWANPPSWGVVARLADWGTHRCHTEPLVWGCELRGVEPRLLKLLGDPSPMAVPLYHMSL